MDCMRFNLLDLMYFVYLFSFFIMDNLKILQWNCRNFYTNFDEFTQFLQKNPCDILCLQSINRKPVELPCLDGFYYPPFYKTNYKSRIGVATYVRSSICVRKVKSPVENDLQVSIELIVNKKPFTITNCYYPVGLRENDIQWIGKYKDDNDQILVLGDFNAHHSYWSNKTIENKRGGQFLYQNIIDSTLTLLNDGSITRIPDRSNDICSAIDLSFISASLASQCQWMVQDDTLGSDHLPIIIDLTFDNIDKIENELEKGFDTRRADWTLFQNILHEKFTLNSEIVHDNVQKQYDHFRKLILEAAEIAIPRKSTEYRVRYGNAWWTEECAVAVRDKKKAYHLFKRHECEETSNNYKKAKNECKKIIAIAKIRYLENYIENNVKDFKDASKLWNKIKKIKNKYNLPEQPLVINGVKTKSNQEKADALAQSFAKNGRTEHLPEEIKQHREKEEETLRNHIDNIDLESDSPNNISFTKTELMICIKQINNIKKATGSDFISYDMIKHFPNIVITKLLEIYNRMYKEGVIPKQWSTAEVKALPKKGKKQSDPNNYRPISLTPHLGKLYERLIKNRLEHFFEKHNLIPSNQAGFKKGRGCTDHIVKLSSNIKKSMSKGKPVMSVFFDIRKAYDSVWIAKVLHKLSLSGIDGCMFHAIKSLISNRNFSVKIGSSKSQQYDLDMGVPQGSVISPIIFNLMLSDINKISLKNCNMTLYADDLTIWMTPQKFKNLYKSKVCMFVRNKLQENINKILTYMKNSGFQFSAEKTTLIIFSGRHKVDKTNIYIKINETKIFPSNKAKYLGVTFDDHLNWKNHIQDIIRKTDMIWGILKSLKQTPGGNYIPNLLKVIHSLVRSKLSYGQEVYFSANKSLLKSLQIKECHFLRFALGLAPGTPQEIVYREAGWLPLDLERKLRCAQYFFRSKMVINSTNEELKETYDDLFYNENDNPPTNNINNVQRCIPFHYYIKNVINEANIDENRIIQSAISPIPPWIMLPCTFDIDYANDYSKYDNQLYISQLAKERIYMNYYNHLKIYTDGSKLSTGEVGCAFYIPDLQIKQRYKLNENISIFSAELFALYMTLNFINDFPRTIFQIVICSDSKSVLQALNAHQSKNRPNMILECKILIHQILSKGTQLALMWIPSHSGIRGNDFVDKEAKLAAQKDEIDFDIGLSLLEIYSKLKNTIKQEWDNQFECSKVVRNWNDYKRYENPSFAHSLHPLFHRLRTGYTLYHYRQIKCICNENLSCRHIFECNELIPKFETLIQMLGSLGVSPTPALLLSKHEKFGWKITEVFLRCLISSDIGHLI